MAKNIKKLANKIADLHAVDDDTAFIVATIVSEHYPDTDIEDMSIVDSTYPTLDIEGDEWTWRSTEEEAEEETKEMLMDEPELWKQAVASDSTTSSLEEWVEEVLRYDGWAHVMCGYDGNYYEVGNGAVYWQTN